MVAEMPLLSVSRELLDHSVVPATLDPQPTDGWRPVLADALERRGDWPRERKNLVLTLLEDSTCKLSALHAEVLLRWRDGQGAGIDNPSLIQARAVQAALQQDADSKRPVVSVKGPCTALLGPPTPTNEAGKGLGPWQGHTLCLNLARLAEVLAVDRRKLDCPSAASAPLLPAGGVLPSFLFDYESPSCQALSVASHPDASTFNITSSVQDELSPPGSVIHTREDGHPADPGSAASLPPVTPMLQRTSIHSTGNDHSGSLFSPTASGLIQQALHADLPPVPHEVANCWGSSPPGAFLYPQSGSSLPGGAPAYPPGPPSLPPARYSTPGTLPDHAHPAASLTGRGETPRTGYGDSRGSLPVLLEHDPPAVNTRSTWPNYAFSSGGPGTYDSYLSGDNTFPHMYPPPPPNSAMLHTSSSTQLPSSYGSYAAHSPAASGWLTKLYGGDGVGAGDGMRLLPGTAAGAMRGEVVSSPPLRPLPSTCSGLSEENITGGGLGERRPSNGSTGPMDLESALEAIINFESGGPVEAGPGSGGGRTRSAGAVGATNGVSVATAAAAHSTLQHHVQVAMKAAAEHTAASTPKASQAHVDMSFAAMTRLSLDNKHHSAFTNLPGTMGAVPSLHGNQVVGSAPAPGIASYMQRHADLAGAGGHSGTRTTAPELPLPPDALLAGDAAEQQRRAADVMAAAVRAAGGALSRSVPRATSSWAAAAAAGVKAQQLASAQNQQALTALLAAAMTKSKWGGGAGAGVDPATLASLLQGGAAANPSQTRLWPLLSPKLRAEVQQLLAPVPGVRGEDLDDAVLYQLISARQSDEEVLSAMRAVAAMSDLTTGLQQLSALLPGHDGLLSPPFSPPAGSGGGGAMLRSASSMPTSSSAKSALQKLPPKVLTRLEEIVNKCSYLDWKHFDAGVVKVMVQLSDLSEADVMEELQLLEATDLSNVEYMPAYLNKRLNNRLWSRRKTQQAQAAARDN